MVFRFDDGRRRMADATTKSLSARRHGTHPADAPELNFCPRRVLHSLLIFHNKGRLKVVHALVFPRTHPADALELQFCPQRVFRLVIISATMAICIKSTPVPLK